jgi:hypothetical protein
MEIDYIEGWVGGWARKVEAEITTKPNPPSCKGAPARASQNLADQFVDGEPPQASQEIGSGSDARDGNGWNKLCRRLVSQDEPIYANTVDEGNTATSKMGRR